MQSKNVAVLGGDPMLLNVVTPIVDQCRHLHVEDDDEDDDLAGERVKEIGGEMGIFLGKLNLNTHRHLWDVPRLILLNSR